MQKRLLSTEGSRWRRFSCSRASITSPDGGIAQSRRRPRSASSSGKSKSFLHCTLQLFPILSGSPRLTGKPLANQIFPHISVPVLLFARQVHAPRRPCNLGTTGPKGHATSLIPLQDTVRGPPLASLG